MSKYRHEEVESCGRNIPWLDVGTWFQLQLWYSLSVWPRLINFTSSGPAVLWSMHFPPLMFFSASCFSILPEAAFTPDLTFSYTDYYKKLLSDRHFPSFTSLSAPTSAKSTFYIAVSSSWWRHKSHAITLLMKVFQGFPAVSTRRSNPLACYKENRRSGECLFVALSQEASYSPIIPNLLYCPVCARSIQLRIFSFWVLCYPLPSLRAFTWLLFSRHSPAGSGIAFFRKSSLDFLAWIWVCLFADVTPWAATQHKPLQRTLTVWRWLFPFLPPATPKKCEVVVVVVVFPQGKACAFISISLAEYLVHGWCAINESKMNR